MKLLVTGVTGQVGHELVRSLQPLGEVVAADSRVLDLADAGAVAATLATVMPDVVVNPAAYTAVDKAETEIGKARAVNAAAPGAMARHCARHGALLVHYSTDYVFDGSGSGCYREDDATAPANAYGLTKLEGEQAIRATGCSHLILRTSWVYSLHGANFLRTMVRLAATRDRLRIVSDQHGVPTPASFIADATAQLIARRRADPALRDWSGILNLAPSGTTTWFDYAALALEILHRATKAADGDQSRLPRPAWQVPRLPALEPIAASEYPTPARRPANSCLDLERVQRVWGLRMPAWDALLASVLRDA
jgi:dTDP-4-dehydrorhamnose reductase